MKTGFVWEGKGHSHRNWPVVLVNVVNGSVGTVTTRHHTGHRGGPAIIASHNGRYLVSEEVNVVAGCDPHIMGIGPVPAIELLLKATNLTQQDIDVFDVRHFCLLPARRLCWKAGIVFGGVCVCVH